LAEGVAGLSHALQAIAARPRTARCPAPSIPHPPVDLPGPEHAHPGVPVRSFGRAGLELGAARLSAGVSRDSTA